jgi:hypothetical protein
MSKRFSIFAAAMVASGRSLSTATLDHSDPRRTDPRARRIDDLSIEERSRYAFDDPEDSTPRRETTVPATRAFVWDL